MQLAYQQDLVEQGEQCVLYILNNQTMEYLKTIEKYFFLDKVYFLELPRQS